MGLWWILGLPGTLVAILLAAALAAWLWAGTSGSLAQALSWAEKGLQTRQGAWGSLQTQGIEGSLRHGGRIAELRWSAPGLRIEADNVQLDWHDTIWLDALRGAGLHPTALNIGALRVHDTRPSTPSEPMVSLTLPLPLSLGFRVDALALSGRTALSLQGLQGHYLYDRLTSATEYPPLPDTPGLLHAHRLRVDGLQWADGQYHAQLSLGAEAPMPMALDLQGDIRTIVPDGAALHLKAQGQVRGTLSGKLAEIQLQALADHAEDPQPLQRPLTLTASFRPWAEQPLIHADLQARQLHLAALWPQAPASAISGSVQLVPTEGGWRAQLDLENTRTGPIDQGGLPVSRLQAQVHQRGAQWTASDLRVQLGGGELRGQGSFQRATADPQPQAAPWQAEISLQGLRADQLWSTLPPGALDGRLSAEAAPSPGAPQAVNLRAHLQPSTRQPTGALQVATLRQSQLSLEGQWRPDARQPQQGELALKGLHIALMGMDLTANGNLNTARRTWNGQLRLGMPGASLALEGLAAHAQGQGTAELTLASAARWLDGLRALQDLPFVGKPVQTALEALTPWRVDGEAQTKLQWTGGLGGLGWPAPVGEATPAAAPLPRLQASLQIPRLQWQHGPQHGSPGPSVLSEVHLQAQGLASALRWTLKGRATAAPWHANLNAGGAAALAPDAGRLDLNQLSLHLQDARAAAQPPAQSTAWTLDNTADLQLRWEHDPASGWRLDADQGTLQLQPSTTKATGVDAPLTLRWQQLRWQTQTLQTQGSLQGLSLAWIDALSTLGRARASESLASHGLNGDLVFDAQWQMRLPTDATGPLQLSAALQRRSGDLRWLGAEPVVQPPLGPSRTASARTSGPLSAGVRDARLELRVQDQSLQALLRWDTERLGQAQADFSSRLDPTRQPTGANALERWWPADSPVQGSAQVRLPEVGVWSMLAPPGWRMSGTLSADARLSGTRGTPLWQGSVQGDELSLRSVVDGIAFGNGQLRATLAGERISVDRLSFQGLGGADTGGLLEASGLAEWRSVAGSSLRQPFIELQAQAQRLRISTRADRRLTLSGKASATLSGAQLQLRGQLKADAALFLLPDEMAPSLDDDVIVRTTSTPPSDPADAQRVRPDVALDLDLGPAFEVRGLGAQTRLEGRLRVLATPNAPTPRVMGEVRAASGTYRAYGQQLDIETGVLRFTGPYDDPALDIRAVRKLPENTEQRVGVQIGGHAQAPRLSLFAEPDLPDADKLAWLVLGRPASASGAQAFVLQQAARRLLSRGNEPMDDVLARSLGLDEIGFTSTGGNAEGTSTDAALTLGKRLSSDLYLSYEQSVTGAMSTVSILYDISRRLTLRARAGTENAVDLIFTRRFD